jgi:hypothetical protein
VGAATFGSHLVTSGNVGVGVSTADTGIHANRATTTAGQGPAITLSREDEVITGADTLGRIYFAGTEDGGSNWLRGASITAKAGGAWAGGDIPATLAISTCPAGSDTLTTALLVGSDQSLSGSGALHIDGATTIGNTFAATGSIVAGTTVTAGSGLIGNTLDIGGSDLVVTAAGNLSGSGTLQSVGATILGSTLNVSGATTVAGAVSGSGALHIDGATTIGNTFAATGSIVAGTTVTAGSGLIGNTLDIGGSDLVITAAGNVSGSGTLYAAGAATFSSTVSSTGSISSSASLVGNILNIGASDYLVTADGNVSGSGTLYGAGAATFSSTLAVTGATTLKGALSGSGTLYNAGAATFSSTVSSTGSISSSASLIGNVLNIGQSDYLVTSTGNVSGSGTLYNAGAATFSSTLAVSGATTMKGQLTVINGIDAEFLGNTTLGNAGGDSVTINAATVNIPNVAAGTDNTVVVYNGSTLLTDEIDSRVWGSTLVDASGTPVANQIAVWTDANTAQGLTTLIYDGTTLAITGAISGSGNISGSAFYGDGSNLTGVDSVSGSSRHYSTIGLATSGYLTVSGAATIGGAVSGSGTFTVTSLTASADVIISGSVGIGTVPAYDLHVNGAGVTVATIDGGASSDAYLKLATAGTEKGYLKLGSGGNVVLAQDATGGDLLLKAKPGGVSTTYLTLDGGDTTIVAGVPISAQAVNATAVSSSTTLQAVGATILGSHLTVSGNFSGSGTLYNAGAATFSSAIAATGSVTAAGLYSTQMISGSLGMHIDQPASFGGAVVISSSMTAAGVNTTGKISGSLGLHVDQASTFGNTVHITGNVGIGGPATMPLDVQSDSVPHARFANTANDANGALLRLQNTRATSNAGQADDFCGGLSFLAQDSGADSTQYSKISTKIGNPANTAEAGYMLFEVTTAGTTATSYLNLNGLKSAITASMPIHFQSASYFSGSIYRRNKNVQGSNYTLTPTDNLVFMDTNSNGVTASLPTINSEINGIEYTIKNIGTKTMVIGSPGTTIDGSPVGLTGSLGSTWTLFADDDIWIILSSYAPPA